MGVAKVAGNLEASVTDARTWLRELGDEQVRFKPSPDRWSIAEVVGHLVDSACNNHQRFIRAQTTDLLSFPKYEQNDWAKLGHYHTMSWQQLVELWFNYNCLITHVIRNIPDDQLLTRCEIVGYEPCTLDFLVEDYLVHLNHHLTKIRERIG